MPRSPRKKSQPRTAGGWQPVHPPLAPPQSLEGHRPTPVSDEEIVSRLNDLLEAERAGVEAAAALRQVPTGSITAAELDKFADDEATACAGLHQSILRYGGQPADRTGDFGRSVAALKDEGERLNLMTRGQAWVVKRLDVLLGMPLDAETRIFLAEMRAQHLENIEACHRRAEEVSAPPSPPYRDLPFARLREAHDRLYYGPWRTPTATLRDYQRGFFQLGRYLDTLAEEVQRTRSVEARSALARARAAHAKADPEADRGEVIRRLDNSLSYAHSALNALLRQYRAPSHDPRDFESFYDVIGVPFEDLV
ncbi:MAG TPA: DUF6306 domain-containing protein [Candidatus Methylomirabilis sp.]|nr:DUF6306 domain-containing protein [Candidatus Methylomirabilis sp.]